ncbi:hypothetical protein GCM10011613_07930 [Cellvibrio zantedeschiae]|uniref:DUF4154 domain-containing protein n=2 Tax=Cellvibrio zantedeschiae TaxID=1237077 RepID=A0ABQ3ASF4_9GAMM|nr:hypothetical protein GCM10011613_07930 [Cellvibrio zantedeschiae]
MKFIEWPDQTSNPSLRLCALGATGDAREALKPLNGQQLSTQVVDGKPVVKQVIELVYFDDPTTALQQLKSCQMIYRPAFGTPIAVPSPLPAGVLLVADDPHPSEANVAIALIRNHEGRIEFSISLTAANQAGVSISSQLLKLAKNSRGGRE